MMLLRNIYTYRDKNGVILGYKLVDKAGNMRDVESKELKQLIRDKQAVVVNLLLTSDNRLITRSEAQDKNIPMGVSQEIVDERKEFVMTYAVVQKLNDLIPAKADWKFVVNKDPKEAIDRATNMGYSIHRVGTDIVFFNRPDTNQYIINVCADVCYVDNTSDTDTYGVFHTISAKLLDLSDLNFSKTTSLKYCFSYSYNLQTVLFGDHADTSNVRNMSGMFRMDTDLVRVDLDDLDVSNVEDMSEMFKDCKSLQEVDLVGWDTRKCRDFSDMFGLCRSIETLDLQVLNTENAESLVGMFEKCDKLQFVNVSSFNTHYVRDFLRMFEECRSLTELNLDNFSTDSMTSCGRMFCGCLNLTKVSLSNFHLNDHLTSVDDMFGNCNSLKETGILADDEMLRRFRIDTGKEYEKKSFWRLFRRKQFMG